MRKETKLGIFAILILATSIWGYNYLKGKNLLSRSQVFYVEYENISELMVSSPVKINGFQVGTVTNIALKKEDMRTIVTELNVDISTIIPRNARAIIEPVGIMGGSQISIEFDGPCTGADCAESGAYFQGGSASLLSKLMDQDQVDGYFQKLKMELGLLVDTLDQMSADPGSKNMVGQSLYDTRQILANTRVTTEELALLVTRLGNQMTTIMKDLQVVTGTLKTSNQDISGILANTNTITTQVKEADLGKAISASQETLKGLDITIAELNTATSELQTILKKVSNGDGTLGKLVNDPTIYQNLIRTSKNLDLLLQDFRLNPKRYVNVSVIGRKQTDYELPEADPAFPPQKAKE